MNLAKNERNNEIWKICFTEKDSLVERHEGSYLFGIVPASNRVSDGAELLIDGEVNSHTREWSENVREQDAPVGLVVSPWLQRHFDGDLRDLRSFSKGWIFLTQITILLDMTTGLSHHPDRGTLRLFPSSCPNQQGGTFRVVHVGFQRFDIFGDGRVKACATGWLSAKALHPMV